jgi:hypothetical protein
MKIGLAQENITPPLGTQMTGQLLDYRAKGVESDLYVTAMVLGDGDSRLAFVSCDVLIISNTTAAEIGREVATRTGIAAENVIVCATHTHSGPILENLFGLNADLAYIEHFKAQIVKAIQDAENNCVQAELHVAGGELPGYGFNRRFIMSSGTVETHPLKGDPHIVRAEGPDSKDLSVLFASNEGGDIIGACVIYGCHATVMPRDNEMISSDFPGKTSKALSEHLGGVPVLYLQGACGDICQVNALDPQTREVGPAWAVRMGAAISARVAQLIASDGRLTRGPVRVVSETIALTRRAIDPALVEWAMQHEPVPCEIPLLSDYGSETYGMIERPKVALEELFKTPFWSNFYANEIKTLEKDRAAAPTMPFTIRVIARDDWAMVTLPCELFVALNNAICRHSPFEHTTVVELANGWCGYIPTRESFTRKGGYETKEVTTTMLVPEAGDMLLESVTRLLRAAHGAN